MSPSTECRRAPYCAGSTARRRVCPVVAGLLLALTLGACGRPGDPPGATREPLPVTRVIEASQDPLAKRRAAEAPRRDFAERLGTIHDNLPFTPEATRIASIAWRTWVYTDTGPKRTRYGYLRAGAVLDARGPAIINDGCRGGWYRINPFGFVCLGKGATKDLQHPVVVAMKRRPERGAGLPYVYARAGEVPPHRFFRIPSPDEMSNVEGEWKGRARRLLERAQREPLASVLGPLAGPPEFLADIKETPKPYGVKEFLHYSVHTGRAASDSGFALLHVFQQHDRAFGLTSELDVIALDRTKVVVPSALHGIVLEPDQDLPVAFVDTYSAVRYEEKDDKFRSSGGLPRRTGLVLTGRSSDYGRFLETTEGFWVVPQQLRQIPPRTGFPSFATGRRKWIDISIRRQTLVAFEGRKAVFATLVSTGRGGLGDPEKTFATIRGTFMIHSKHVSATMDGEQDKADSYNLQDVPFVQYFHKGFALHGTYWHDDFGKVRSHGCINLAPRDAAWLFEWTDPRVPPGWHARLNKKRGTVVYIHP